MASLLYTTGGTDLGTGAINWTSDTIKVLLARSSYTPSAAHQFVSSITNEVSGGGYARETLASKTKTDNTTDSRLEYDAADIAYSSLTSGAGTFKYAIVFKDTGSDATSPLICCIDLGSISPVNGEWILKFKSAGLLYRPLVLDSFTRADSTTTIGTGWTNQQGTGGISSNQAYPQALASSRFKATRVGLGTYAALEAKIATVGTNPGLFVRSSGVTGILIAYINSSTRMEAFNQTTAAAYTTLATGGTFTLSAGDILRVVVTGNSYNILVNGTSRLTLTDVANEGKFEVGFYAASTATRFDDLRIEGDWVVPVLAQESGVYDYGDLGLWDGSITWASDTIKMMLVKETYTPDLTFHQFVSQASAHELSGGSYARQTLASKTSADDSANTRWKWDADDVSFGTITAADPPRYALIFKDTGSDATAPLIAWIDLGVMNPISSAPFAVNFSANGAFTRLYHNDDFNRADSTTTIGGSWTVDGAAVFGISSNRGRVQTASGAENYIWLDVGTSRVLVEYTVSTQGTSALGMMMRYIDANNRWIFNPSDTAIGTFRSYGGTHFSYSSVGVTIPSGTVVRGISSGGTHKFYKNGTLTHTISDDFAHLNSVKVGLRPGSTTHRWDDFRVYGVYTVHTVTYPSTASPDLANASASAFDASAGSGLFVNPDLAQASASAFDVSLTVTIIADLASATAEAFVPTVDYGEPDVTAYVDQSTPEDGETEVEPLDLLNIVWRSIDPVLRPLVSSTGTITIDGGPTLSVTKTANPDDSVTLSATFPYTLGRTYDITTTIETADTILNTEFITFSVRSQDEPGLAIVDILVIAPGSPTNALVDLLATGSGVPSYAVVDMLAMAVGIEFEQTALVELIVTQGTVPGEFSLALVDLTAAIFVVHLGAALAADIGPFRRGDHGAAVEIDGLVVHIADALGVEINANVTQIGQALAVEIGRAFRQTDYGLAGDIGPLLRGWHGLSMETKNRIVGGLVRVGLLSEAMAAILLDDEEM